MQCNTKDWQLGLDLVAKRFGKLLQLGLHSDCEFIVGNESNSETIVAHRLILAAASPVFETMFYGSMKDTEMKPIKVVDVQPNEFKIMLRYIYTDEADLTSFSEVCEVCYTAKKYMIHTLVELCTHFIWKDLHPGNVCSAFQFAKLFEEPQIVDKCINMIRERTEEIISLPSFSEVETSTLEMVLCQDELEIAEIDLWNACVSWSKVRCEKENVELNATNQRRFLEPVLHLIRFLAMNPNQFARGPATTNILTQEESLKVLLSLSSGTTNLPLELSPKTNSRHCLVHDTGIRGTPTYLTCTCGTVRIDSFNNSQLVDCTLAFECNSHIMLEGIRLPTQLVESVSNEQSDNATHYSELIYAFLQDADGFRITYTHCSSRVMYGQSLDIFFNRLTLIQPNKKYKVVAALNKVGRYPIFSVDRLLTTNNITFNFSDNFGKTTVKAMLFSIP